MALFKLAAMAAAGYALYRYAATRNERREPVAFATGETSAPGFAAVRNAGPEAMRMDPPEWDKIDQESDESFPASDPPPMGKR